jgi:diguanylate cyclase (GGDEF)-like protein
VTDVIDCRLAGSACPLTAAVREGIDPQAGLVATLVEVGTQEQPSVQRILDIVHRTLRQAIGLASAAVYTFESEHEPPTQVAAVGVAGNPALSVEARRMAVTCFTRSAVVAAAGRLVVPVRIGGATLGVLALAGGAPRLLRRDVVDAVALHVAGALRVLVHERDQQFAANSAQAIRRLFDDGATAASIEAAAEILARVTADAFRTERGGLLLIDGDGRIRYTVGVGLSSQLSAALARAMVGKIAADSPGWQTTAGAFGPVLVDDASIAAVRPGGLVRTMELLSYVAMPLVLAGNLVGMAVCGDASRRRIWSAQDRELATQLALEGALILDSARLRQAEQARVAELTHQAFHDALTGLPNRSLLLGRMSQAVSAATDVNERVGLLLLDLDGFKQVNDTFGHQAGDVLLQNVADRLLHVVHDHHTVARLGGDEFAVLVADNPDLDTVSAIACQIHDHLTKAFPIDDRHLSIGASIGIALFPEHGTDVADLLRSADNAMYQAKQRGGGHQVSTADKCPSGPLDDRDFRT